MVLRIALTALGLTLVLTAPHARAQAQPDCDAFGALRGVALSSLSVPLPAEGAQVWAVAAFDTLPQALPLRRTGPESGVLLLPMTRTLDLPETVPLALVGLNGDIDDEAATLAWICPDLVLQIDPPPPDPGGALRFAARAESLATRYDATLAALPVGAFPPFVTAADQLRALAADLRSLPFDSADLARADAVLGAMERAAAVTDAAPDPAPLAPARRAGPGKFFPAELATTSPLDMAPDGEMNLCPRDPQHLTQLIHLGTHARISAQADMQLMLTTGMTLAGASLRLLNAGSAGNATIDKAIDYSTTTLTTAQAILTDYLAGMAPLNLERLELAHDPPYIPDDAPPDQRLMRLTSARLYTRSDGWSPDKAALDGILGLVALRTGGGASGAASGTLSRRLREGAGSIDELVEAVAAGNRAVSATHANAVRMRRIADTVEAQRGLAGGPRERVIDYMRAQSDQAMEAADLALDAANAARTQLAAAPVRTATADALDFGIAPTLGIAEGQLMGRATTAAGNSDWAPIGRIVSRCRVEMLRDADGSRSRHLIHEVIEGNGEVIEVSLGEQIGFEAVGGGLGTARVALNPVLEYFPITRHDRLPEARVDIEVGQIHARIDGLPAVVPPWSIHTLRAQVSGVLVDPPLTWEVEPPLPLTVTGGRGDYTAELIIPDDVPEGTLITVRVRAEGDFLSSKRREPVWSVVAQVRAEDEDEGPPAQCAPPESSARLRRLPAGSLLSGTYRFEGHSQAIAYAIQPCGHVSTEFHASPAAAGLGIERGADGVLAWGGLPVYRLSGIDAVEEMFAARGVCPPSTPWGTVRDWLAPAGDRVETYLLGDCGTILFVTPTRGLLIERPFADRPTAEDWLFNFYLRD